MGSRNKLLLFATLATPALFAGDLQLQPETLRTWDEYVHKAKSSLQQRAQGNRPYLWMEEKQDRMAQVRAGEIVVWQASETNPRRVPSGLIHDWMGGGFIPNVKIDDLLSVVRDYSRYKDVYKPGILEAKLLSQNEWTDRFSMLLKNGSFFTKTALDSEFDSSYVQIDDKRWYSVACTNRVQEIDNYGLPGEHKLPPDQGHGYIWRMCNLGQLEERDGGVYVDEELIALSREIPVGLRWIAGPIIRRVAKESLALSIEKTRIAVVGTRSNLPTVASKAGSFTTAAICGRGTVGCLR